MCLSLAYLGNLHAVGGDAEERGHVAHLVSIVHGKGHSKYIVHSNIVHSKHIVAVSSGAMLRTK